MWDKIACDTNEMLDKQTELSDPMYYKLQIAKQSVPRLLKQQKGKNARILLF